MARKVLMMILLLSLIVSTLVHVSQAGMYGGTGGTFFFFNVRINVYRPFPNNEFFL